MTSTRTRTARPYIRKPKPQCLHCPRLIHGNNCVHGLCSACAPRYRCKVCGEVKNRRQVICETCVHALRVHQEMMSGNTQIPPDAVDPGREERIREIEAAVDRAMKWTPR